MDQQPGSPQGPRDQGPQDARSLPGCYRHPGRETGVRCTRCERPICPECMVSASVGFQCPDCVRGGSGTGHAPAASRPRTLAGGTIAADPRLVTKVLIGLNLAIYLVQLSVGYAFTNRFTLFGNALLMRPPAGRGRRPVVPDADVDVPAQPQQLHAHHFQHAQPVVGRRPAGGGPRPRPLHHSLLRLGSRGQRAHLSAGRPDPADARRLRRDLRPVRRHRGPDAAGSTTTCARSSPCW